MTAAIDLIWEHSYGATTVDAICERANVKKGSFYYFFESKSDLAVAALDSAWGARKQVVDAIFSPTVPPLDRIRQYCHNAYELQVELKRKCGQVLGCPLFTLGSEVSTQDQLIRQKVEDILGQYMKYFESAIRDAHAEGLIDAPDAAIKARVLFAYFEGVLTQARIQNDPEVLKELENGFLGILGANRKRLAVNELAAV